ncbi:ATP-binding protein [Salininema proteolyticum]|uniref:ATP-binding protein n=1 Tax=Salininema proteolyticum TaxID=1607685 RepID=A0ABV8TXV1_9ACTN
MSRDFIGRSRELEYLRRRLDLVRRRGEGRALAMRGRRQVGKSRLVQELCNRSEVPYFYFSFSKGMPVPQEVENFTAELRRSPLAAEAGPLPEVRAGSWSDAFSLLSLSLPDSPSIVVLDEVPWAAEADVSFEGVLQTVWDRQWSRKPILLLLLGSDLHMMERLTSYDRPFYGRAVSMQLRALNPADCADHLALGGADALDAYLISGGMPGILTSWQRGMRPDRYLQEACEEVGTELFTIPMQAVLAEFPGPGNTRRVLEAIGTGNRTQAKISSAAGNLDKPLDSGVLTPILRTLSEQKRVVAAESPLSTKKGQPRLYSIADPNLRLYFAVLRESYRLAERGLTNAAMELTQRRWPSWRGRAIEPVIREALTLAADQGRLPWDGVRAVGGWWNRRFDPEVDLIGADDAPIAGDVSFAGTVKWLARPMQAKEVGELRRATAVVPGAEGSDLVGVSLTGFSDEARESLTLAWGPDDVVDAFRVR